MFLPRTKKAARLQVLLLIGSIIFFPLYSLAQKVDTATLRKDISALLKRHGLKNAPFEIKIESANQKGGQTAYIINNYNGRETHIVNGSNYGVNGNLSVGVPPRIISTKDLTQLFTLFPGKQTPIEFQFIGLSTTSEMENLKKQFINILKDNGYTNIEMRAGYALQTSPPPQNMWMEKKGNGVVICIAPQ